MNMSDVNLLRQDLCETLMGVYRAYQSGPYTYKGFVRGYLLDGTPSPRDFMNGQIIISHWYLVFPFTSIYR